MSRQNKENTHTIKTKVWKILKEGKAVIHDTIHIIQHRRGKKTTHVNKSALSRSEEVEHWCWKGHERAAEPPGSKGTESGAAETQRS